MHPRDRRRRGGGTALLAALAITGLTAALAGCEAGDAASEQAITSSTASTAQRAGIELRTLTVVHIAYIPEIPRPPKPPPSFDHLRLPTLPRPFRPLDEVPAVTDPVQDRKATLIRPLNEDRLSREEIHEIIELACGTYDLYNITQANDLDDAINKSMMSFGGTVMRPARTVELIKELHEARSSVDEITQAAAFSLCGGNAVLANAGR
jgi:hypothetical protein